MAIYSMRTDVPLHPEDTVLQHLTDMVIKGGVLNPATDMLTVEPAGGGLNVDVGQGRAYVKKGTGNAHPIRITATETVPISANASGNPRITSIVLYLDKTATPAEDSPGDDVAFLTTVDGTPAASPAAPLEADIEAEIGANNPYIVLDNVTVSSGATGISNANIARVVPRAFLKTPKPTHTIPYAASITPDYQDGDQQKVTLTGNITVVDPENMAIDDWLMLEFLENGTGGYTITWFGTIKWMSADTSQNTAANKTTVYAIKKVAADVYHGYLAGKEYT